MFFWSGGLTYWISKDKVNSIKVKDLSKKGKNIESGDLIKWTDYKDQALSNMSAYS